MSATAARPKGTGSRPATSGGAGAARSGGKRPGDSGGARPARRPTRAALPVSAGIAWAAVLVGALSLSSLATVVVMAPVAVVAAVSVLRAPGLGRRRPARSIAGPAAAVTVVVPLAALGGPLAGLGALLVVGGGAAALMWLRGVAAARVAATLAPALAVTSVVIARHESATLALGLVAATLAYDLGAFVMGDSRRASGGLLGVGSGVASVAVVAVFCAAIMDPPFAGVRPVIVFAGIALLAPVGVWLCDSAMRGEHLPATRRLDSLVLTAPFWALASALLLHR